MGDTWTCSGCGLVIPVDRNPPHTACVRDLRVELAETKAERSEAWERTHNLEVALDKALAEIDSLKAALERAEAACQQKHRVHPSWVTKVSELEAALAAAQERVKALQAEAKMAWTNLSSAHEERDEANARVKELEKELRSWVDATAIRYYQRERDEANARAQEVEEKYRKQYFETVEGARTELVVRARSEALEKVLAICEEHASEWDEDSTAAAQRQDFRRAVCGIDKRNSAQEIADLVRSLLTPNKAPEEGTK